MQVPDRNAALEARECDVDDTRSGDKAESESDSVPDTCACENKGEVGGGVACCFLGLAAECTESFLWTSCGEGGGAADGDIRLRIDEKWKNRVLLEKRRDSRVLARHWSRDACYGHRCHPLGLVTHRLGWLFHSNAGSINPLSPYACECIPVYLAPAPPDDHSDARHLLGGPPVRQCPCYGRRTSPCCDGSVDKITKGIRSDTSPRPTRQRFTFISVCWTQIIEPVRT